MRPGVGGRGGRGGVGRGGDGRGVGHRGGGPAAGAPGNGRIVLVLLVSTVALQVLTYAYRPTLAYAALDAGGVPALLGLLSAVFALPALAAAIPLGHLVDRTSERLVGGLGGALMLASLGVAILAPRTFGSLLLATLIFGLAHLGTVIAQQTLVANATRAGRGDANFGWYTLAASVGQALGPLLLLIPGERAGQPAVSAVFVVCLGLSVLVLVAALCMPRRPRRPTQEAAPGAWASAAHNLRQPGTVRALLASGISLASVDITLVYWPGLGHERALAPAVISVMLFARAAATMASRGFLAWSTRQWGRRRVMIVTLGASAVALAVTAVPVPVPALVVAAVIYGLGIGACQPITMAWLSSLAAPGRRGAMLSLRLVGNRLAQSTIPAVAGLGAASLGSAGVIGVLAGFLVVATWSGAVVPDAEES